MAEKTATKRMGRPRLNPYPEGTPEFIRFEQEKKEQHKMRMREHRRQEMQQIRHDDAKLAAFREKSKEVSKKFYHANNEYRTRKIEAAKARYYRLKEAKQAALVQQAVAHAQALRPAQENL